MEPEPAFVRLSGVSAEAVPAIEPGVRAWETVDTFTEFYRTSRDPIARALAVTLANRDLATEAADEAMARAYQRWAHVGEMANPAGWVYRVGFNWACSGLRRRKRAPEPLAVADHDSAAAGVSEPDILKAVAELEVRQRAVVVCRYLLGWSEAETAVALSTPVGTVKSRLHRASQRLAVRLAHLGPEGDSRD